MIYNIQNLTKNYYIDFNKAPISGFSNFLSFLFKLTKWSGFNSSMEFI